MKIRIALAALLASTAVASAADLKVPYKAPPVAVAPLDPWTGLYLGINAGYGFNLSGMTANAGPFFTTDQLGVAPQGFAGGLQAGYNFRLLPGTFFLQGIEAEINGANLTGSGAMPGFITSSSQLNWFGSVGARLGVTLFPNWFLYGFAGLAFGDPKDTFTLGNVFCNNLCSTSVGGTETGLAWGIGSDFAISQDGHWKLGFDWRRYQFGTSNASITPTGMAVVTFQPKQDFDVIRARVNYNF